MATPLRIGVHTAYDGTPQTFYPIVVVGAGSSGIATGCRLKQKYGFDQFCILERQDGIGGTWWANRYPGVVCDVPTLFYSFSFAPNYRSRTIFLSGCEYVEYLYTVIERAGIADKIQLNTEVISAEWIEQDAEWELEIRHRSGNEKTGMNQASDGENCGKTIRAKTMISAVGILVQPNGWPAEVPGRDAFYGQVLHSSQWPAKTNFDGRDVVLIGAGCSAAQIVPVLLQTNIKSLTQVMRSPPWFFPRIEEPGGKAAYAKWAPRIYGTVPGMVLLMRMLICCLSEALWYAVFQRWSAKLRRRAEAACLSHMRALAPAKYHAMLTPRYSLGGKRRVFDNDWLKSMDDHVSRTELTVGNWEPNSSDAEPITYHGDVVVLATGFNATHFLQGISIIGRQGLSLHGIWATRGGAHAYMGTAVDGFPNLFMIMGPNTFVGHTSAIRAIENNIGYVCRLIQPILRGAVLILEPKTEAVQKWVDDIRRDMKTTVLADCESWYNGNGVYNSVMYP
ncbi:hypothetical protein BBP40_006631 [Aspergillus hancockii]|nr:hypothetical protein BBP40_006631 [Aspergillus hancockii]